MKTALLAILLFCVMIFPHELGHFIAAKKCGIQVNEFAFGMGPKIWKKQRGETLHSIRLFPIGGFCAMEGEDGGDSVDEEGNPKEYNPRAFKNKKPWQKLIVLAAGSFMNVVCAIVIMTLIVGIMGFATTVIGEVEKGTPAEKTGILQGDKIVKINGEQVESWETIAKNIQESNGESIELQILRNSEEKSLLLTPEPIEGKDGQGNVIKSYKIGIRSKVSHNPIKAVVGGVIGTWNMGKTMIHSVAQLFSGEVGTDELAGPVGMISMVNQTSKAGWVYYGFLTAMICLNLAIINMLPLPALDGGRIIFVIYSWITKREISEKVEGTVHAIGLVLLLALMVYVTKNDIVRLFS